MYSFFFFFTFWPHPVGCRIRNLRSPTRDWAHTLCIGRQSLIHWTSREAPTFPLCSGVSWIFSALIVVDTWPRHLPWDGYRRASLKNVPDSHQPLLCAAFFFLALFLREIVIFLIILEVYVIQLYHDFPPMNKKKKVVSQYTEGGGIYWCIKKDAQNSFSWLFYGGLLPPGMPYHIALPPFSFFS